MPAWAADQLRRLAAKRKNDARHLKGTTEREH